LGILSRLRLPGLRVWNGRRRLARLRILAALRRLPGLGILSRLRLPGLRVWSDRGWLARLQRLAGLGNLTWRWPARC
jgi:hypothetical protein